DVGKIAEPVVMQVGRHPNAVEIVLIGWEAADLEPGGGFAIGHRLGAAHELDDVLQTDRFLISQELLRQGWRGEGYGEGWIVNLHARNARGRVVRQVLVARGSDGDSP